MTKGFQKQFHAPFTRCNIYAKLVPGINILFDISISLFLDEPPVPEIDLAFAISATASDADKTFSLVKDTTKYIVNKYGTDKIHYGLLVFGTVPSRVRDFRREAFTKEEMIRLLNSVPRSSTG